MKDGRTSAAPDTLAPRHASIMKSRTRLGEGERLGVADEGTRGVARGVVVWWLYGRLDGLHGLVGQVPGHVHDIHGGELCVACAQE